MRPVPVLAVLAVLLAAVPRPAPGQEGPPVVRELAADLEATAGKMAALARAIPAEEWGWRPAPGVRSVEEVLRHVAYDNFYFPTAVGVAAPEATGITSDYATARAFGERSLSREETLEALEASFVHLQGAVLGTTRSQLGEEVRIFDRSMSARALWIMAAGHAHEHLGQLIAYARTRGVVPPWSGGD